MTKEEKLIVSAYTGFLMCDWDDLHKFIEDTLGRPVWTHELADDKVNEEIRLRLKPRFLAICAAREESSQPRWIPVTERLPNNDDFVIVTVKDESGDSPYIYSDFGWYLDRAGCWIVNTEQRTDITHWMPLPKPPKEGQA